jgi:5-methylthioadenosine/S-adenosylhomocysteine deaminase
MNCLRWSPIAASLLVCFSFGASGLHAQAAVHEPQHLLIHGRIVMPAGVAAGWLDIAGGRILHIDLDKTGLDKAGHEKPELADAKVLDTNDLIFPGFIDLHNHPSYNILPRWTPPHTFPNRYAWRDWDVYQRELESKGRALIGDPANFCDIDEYAEVKALIGGTTSLIGLGSTKPGHPTPNCIRGLVRNLDHYTGFYGPEPDHERIANSIGVLPCDTDAELLAHYAQAIHDGHLDLLAIHIAEGLPTDAESGQELDMLDAHGLLGSHTALIHSVGLSPSQLKRVHRAGASIVWSPRSNFVLYGATANVDAAFREGVTMSLAPDWSPTGSDNMWEEIQYAAQVNETKLEELFSNRQLVEMASAVPARVARIDDKVGVIAPGMLADFFLVHTGKVESTNPYDAVVHEPVTAISLVVIGGVPVYGDAGMLEKLKISAEPLELCGMKKALNSAALPNGSFAAVEERLRAKLKALGTDLGPLDSCRQ